MCSGHYLIANNLISTYDLLYKILKKPVINTELTIDDVVEKASIKNH